MDSAHFLSLLKLMGEEMESVAKDAKTVYEEAVKIRKRSEEVEVLVCECLDLLDDE